MIPLMLALRPPGRLSHPPLMRLSRPVPLYVRPLAWGSRLLRRLFITLDGRAGFGLEVGLSSAVSDSAGSTMVLRRRLLLPTVAILELVLGARMLEPACRRGVEGE
jgi:hypothetical protein